MDFSLDAGLSATTVLAAVGGLAVGVGGTLSWLGLRRRCFRRQLAQVIAGRIDGVGVYDGRARLVACNAAYRGFFQPAFDRFSLGIRFDELIDRGGRALGRDAAWRTAKLESWQAGVAGDEDVCADGRWVSVHTYPLPDGGQLRVLRDVTQRRQVEESLVSTVTWLRGVMDTVLDGILTIDEAGVVLSFNPAAERIFGYEADAVVGRNITMLMPGAFAADHQCHINRYMHSREPHIIGIGREVRGRRRDGSEFPLDISVAEMHQGDLVTFIGVTRDITERKRAETALIEGEARFREQASRLQAIIDNMAQGVAVFGADDTLTALNQTARRMLGLPAAELTAGAIDLTLLLALLVSPETPPGTAPVRDTVALAEALRRRPDLIFERQGAAGVMLEVRASPMPGGGVILCFTDITERKRTESTLREAKEAAERGNRAKNTFLANISHELRTPLNAIIGFSEMMKHEIFGPITPVSYRPYLDDIHDSGMHLLELINDILDMTKAEAGMTDLVETVVDVAGIIRASARMLARRAANAGLTVEASLPEALPLLLADERRMRQIVLNLLSNAVKFTDEGGRVTISARADANGFAIMVTDSGIGMSPEDLVRVMEPFVQADSRLSRKYEGSGLGLPLTKALVEAHGGHFTLDSHPGHGTTAIVTLPAWRITPLGSS